MFDFEQLATYTKAKRLNSDLYKYICCHTKPDRVAWHQLRRASLSIMLNIAEGSGRLSKADKRRFLIMARGSVFECVAIIQFLKEESLLNEELYLLFYTRLEELSRMLFSMIRGLTETR